MAEFKRKKFWIDASLQVKFLAFVLLLLSATILVLYLSLDRGLEQAAEKAQALFLPVSQARAALRTPLILSGSITLIAGLLLTFLWSHRFIGPLKVLANSFKRIREGDLTQEPRIRSTDVLHDLVGAATSMQRELKNQLNQDRRRLQACIEKLNKLSNEHHQDRKLRQALSDIQENLKDVTGFFKL